MTDTDLSYQQTQYDVTWDIIFAGGPGQGNKLIYEHGELKAWMEENYDVRNWAYIDWTISPMPNFAFVLAYSHENHLKLPVPTDSAEIEIDGRVYEDGNKNFEFETVTPRFLVNFIGKFQQRFPANTDLITIVHSLTYARFDPSLSEDDAMNKMMSDDLALMRELDVIE